MEPARGRWFLGEDAKLNRNADTAMVLEAVARLEQNLAAGRAEAAARDEILASVRMILDRTRAALVAALAEPDMEQALSPLRRSARIIQEIAWGLRESGADGRICTILAAQVSAITGASDALAAAEHRDTVLHAFDASLVQIEKLAEHEAIPPAEELLVGDEQTAAARQEIPDSIIPDMDASVIEIDPPPAPAAHAEAEQAAHEHHAAQPSLGDSLIARGIVAPSVTVKPDPLAAIRRMSPAEKIAFFS